MPDLPLPKPQPPTSPTQPSGSTSVMGDLTQTTPTAQARSTKNSQLTPLTPMGQQVAPSVVAPTKPPAVVTALSSVSSNQVPKLEENQDDQNPTQQAGLINASTTPTSGSSVNPPPSLGSNQQKNNFQFTTTKTAVQNSAPQSTNAPQINPTQVVDPLNQVVLPVASPPSASIPQTHAGTQLPATNQNLSQTANVVPPPPSLSGVPTTQINSVSPTNLPPHPTLNSPAPQPLAPGKPSSSQSSTLATPKKSPKKLIIGLLVALIGLVVIGLGVVFVTGRFSGSPSPTSTPSSTTQLDMDGDSPDQSTVPSEQTTIEYWGLWETRDTISSVFQDFQTQNPGLTVRYIQQSHRDFRERLQNAINSGSGPDVFRYHASWAPMLTNELEPIPTSIMGVSEFSETFYPVASRQLQLNGQLVGIPLMYEGLVLYYNQEALDTAGVQPPQTWSAVRDVARTLAIKQPDGQLQRGGVALGTAENVDHFSDILAVLMLQNGANLEQPNSPEGRDALLFYTNFTKQDQVWGSNLPSSTLAFARGDVAMMFAPSWRAFEIMQINPNLKFATVALPQLPNNKITWASYWAEGVSKQSKNKEAAWKLLKYLSTKEVQQKIFSAQSQTRAFGEPFSRVDLAGQLGNQPIIGPLLQDAPAAQGWYMSSFTHDNGINDQIIQYYKDAINSLLANDAIDQVLTTLQQGVNQVLTTYGVVANLVPTPTTAQY